MRIAFIAPYQGPELVKRRPSVKNLGLATIVKIEQFATLLAGKGHTIEVISQGEVDRVTFKVYSAFCESERFHPDVPVYYASALPAKFVCGFWEEHDMLRLFKERHRANPFDIVIIYNTKRGQIACANYAADRLELPVVLDYEDDPFVNVFGERAPGMRAGFHRRACQSLMQRVSACYAVSPHLLSHVPANVPQLLLRGVVSEQIIETAKRTTNCKKDWVAFAGTHTKSKGIAPLIAAWKKIKAPGWELHIAGYGEITPELEKSAGNQPDIVFHGMLRGQALADFLCSAKICINPHELSRVPGNVFAFKIVEYLAAGAHVVTTPMGVLEEELETGLTYMDSNDPGQITATLQQVIQERRWERNVAETVWDTHGPAAVATLLDNLLKQAHLQRAQTPRRRTFEKKQFT